MHCLIYLVKYLFYYLYNNNNNNNNNKYNYLGVTEMRMGHLDKAMKRFKKSLLINPNFQTAKDNINDLNEYLINSKIYIKDLLLNYEQKHKRKIPKIITISEFLTFNNNYYESIPFNDNNGLLKEPFVVKDYYKNWNIDNTSLTIDNLINKFGI